MFYSVLGVNCHYDNPSSGKIRSILRLAEVPNTEVASSSYEHLPQRLGETLGAPDATMLGLWSSHVAQVA